jgi:hypothetical protein
VSRFTSSTEPAMSSVIPSPRSREPSLQGSASENASQVDRLQEEMALLRRQLAEQTAEHDLELSTVRQQLQRCEGSQFAQELNMQVKSKQLVISLFLPAPASPTQQRTREVGGGGEREKSPIPLMIPIKAFVQKQTCASKPVQAFHTCAHTCAHQYLRNAELHTDGSP